MTTPRLSRSRLATRHRPSGRRPVGKTTMSPKKLRNHARPDQPVNQIAEANAEARRPRRDGRDVGR